mgnify:CR=1 FL=1
MRTLEAFHRFKPSRAQLIGGSLILSAGVLALAAVPNTFTSGTTISAAQVNANFSDADSRITTLEATVTGGNVVLAPSTASTGNIMKGGDTFLHNFGLNGTSTFLGRNSGNFTMTGTNNTAVGFNALTNITGGLDNVAMGLNALANNSSANSNTGLGVSALFNTTTGGANVAVGTFALENLISGTNNIAIGYAAGQSIGSSGSSNILIGHNGTAESNTIRIGVVQTRAFIAGIRGVSTGVGNAIPVVIDSSGQLGTVSSSQRVKDDIADMGEASNTLMKLRPVTFHYKSDKNPKGRSLQYGLIAEEVEKVAPGLVARNNKGEIETVYYQHLTPMLLNEYQKQQRVIEAQTVALKKQTDRVAVLEKQGQEIAALKQELARMSAVLARLGQPEKVASVGR